MIFVQKVKCLENLRGVTLAPYPAAIQIQQYKSATQRCCYKILQLVS